jgi:capsular exopolysaccharide synthesis family protein
MSEQQLLREGLPAQEQGFYPYQVLRDVIRRRKVRILVCLALGVALAVAYCALAGPWYESTAEVLVIKKRLQTSPISDPGQVPPQEDYLATHMLLITSPLVVGKAVQKNHLQDLEQLRQTDGFLSKLADPLLSRLPGQAPEGPPDARPLKDIIRSLSVSRDPPKPGLNPSNEILNLSFRGRVPDDCPTILNAVIGSYQDCLKETYRNTNSETLDLIAQARDVVQKDLEAREVAYQKFLQSTPPVWRGKDGGTVHQDRLFTIDARRAALQVRRSEIEASLGAIDQARQTGGSAAGVLGLTAALPANQEFVAPGFLTNPEPWSGGRPTRDTLEEELINLQLQEIKQLEIYGRNHPEVQATRARMEAVRRMILPSSSPSPAAAGGAEKGASAAARSGAVEELAAVKVQLMRKELRDMDAAEKALTNLFEREQKVAGGSFIHEVEDDNHRKGIERTRLLYEGVLHRLEELNSVKDYGWYDMQVIGAPTRGEPATRKYLLVLGLGVFAGLLTGFGSAYLAELGDPRFRTAREVRDRLGLPVLGHIPPRVGRAAPVGLLAGNGNGNGRALDLAEAEAYRAVRAVLAVRARAEGARVIQITSPAAGDGKTTLAVNLAACLAQAGQSVVLVDGDLRRPRVHELCKLADDVGLSTVLAGDVDLATALRPGPVAGLSVLPCGRVPANPAELLASARWHETLAALGGLYDFVLIDTPPLLDAADAAAVVPHVDQILLALHLTRTDRGRAERARELLQVLGARVLGVVVNGSDQGGAAGYG